MVERKAKVDERPRREKRKYSSFCNPNGGRIKLTILTHETTKKVVIVVNSFQCIFYYDIVRTECDSFQNIKMSF